MTIRYFHAGHIVTIHGRVILHTDRTLGVDTSAGIVAVRRREIISVEIGR